ncbi:SusC/RagA family TonB-linked outer membrane protein [Fulvivirgaceae bacterium BMA12]|uniref:SusC/RagA family TonB-linked outer membrane protein n=1 Tax=Agaribacillus aureus TaxID=3051825 RepID=A0ABT8LHU0_9BACT|nr:SusC/RagA family TonB-linked outer membrane protein [Fulvivirgaceae bacterium BMA12]
MKIHLLKVIIAMSKTLLHGVIITCLFTGLLLANDGNAQHKSIKEVHISLELTQATIPATLEKIQEKTDFKFVYEKDVITSTRDHLVTLKAVDQSVFKILKTISNETDLNFRQLDGNIVIKVPALRKVVSVPKEEVLPARVISGTITAEDGEPLAGASVLIKGSTRGAIADIDGKYALNADDEDILVYSFIGYTVQEILVGSQSVIDVVMKEDLTSLNEVVVSTGYWETDKKLNPGNIAKVTANEIERQPIANPLQALQGRIAGVNIQQTTGLPGGGFNIQIRGQNSLRNRFTDNGNLPFYVIDGVPYPSQPLTTGNFGSIINRGNPLNSINANDIESIEILKDADATAIYGSRGANGVVLITTKKGEGGKTKFEVNVSQGIGEVSNMIELLNTQQYLEMRNEAFANDGTTPDPNNPAHFDITQWGNRDTDWQNELIGGTANITNAQAIVSGGNANTQFTIGSGYYRETTVFPGDFVYRKGSGRFSLNHNSNNRKFNISLTTNYIADENNLANTDLTSIALSLPPNHPSLIDEKGNFTWVEGDFSARNPLAELSRKFVRRTNNLTSGANLSYKFGPALQFKTNLGYNRLQLEETQTSPLISSNPLFHPFITGASNFVMANSNSWIIEPQVEFRKAIFSGKLNVLIGSTLQGTLLERSAIIANGFQDDNSLENIAAAGSILTSEYVYNEYRYNAVYARINYNWRDKYIVNLTGRRDGSSRFGSDKQFGNFGAIGAAWIFSNEEFIKQALPLISFGKLRASYGSTGSDQIGDYRFLDAYQYIGQSYLGVPGIRPARLVNPDYSWETNKKFEGGVTLGFIDDRIFFEASYYINRSSNQLVDQPLSSVTGFSGILINFPATVENTGWELEFSSTNLRTEKIKWTTSFNLTIPRNELIEFDNIENSAFANRFEVGKSLFVKPSFQGTAVNSETGIYTFDDLNSDEIMTTEDFVFSEVSQEFFGGLQNSIQYKSFELNFLFQFIKQTGNGYMADFNAPGFNVNQPVEVLQRWQNPGDVTDIQRFTQSFGEAFFPYINASFFGDNTAFVDASFIRLKNLSLSWNIPEVLTKKAKLQNARIYLQGQNLVTITDFVGLDPETQSVSLPPLRVMTMGLNITF